MDFKYIFNNFREEFLDNMNEALDFIFGNLYEEYGYTENYNLNTNEMIKWEFPQILPFLERVYHADKTYLINIFQNLTSTQEVLIRFFHDTIKYLSLTKNVSDHIYFEILDLLKNNN